jgi:hypothetical protein
MKCFCFTPSTWKPEKSQASGRQEESSFFEKKKQKNFFSHDTRWAREPAAKD